MRDGWRAELVGVAVLVFVLGTALLGFTAARTLHRWDVALILARSVVPAVLMLGLALAAGLFGEGGMGGNPGAAVALMAMLTVAPINLALAFNQWADPSPAAPRTLTVLGKTTEQRRRSTVRWLRVDPGVPAPMRGFTLYGDGESIPVDAATYAAAEPGRSTVTLRLHPGRFGYPWFEAEPRVAP